MTPATASLAAYDSVEMTRSFSDVASSAAPLMACRIALGMGEGVAFPAAHSLLGRYIPEEQQTSAVAVITASSYAGIAIAFGYRGTAHENKSVGVNWDAVTGSTDMNATYELALYVWVCVLDALLSASALTGRFSSSYSS